jgi:hypothetical protein
LRLLGTWFGDLCLSLSANKSKMMVFSWKHPQVLVWLGQSVLQNVTEFKCLNMSSEGETGTDTVEGSMNLLLLNEN